MGFLSKKRSDPGTLDFTNEQYQRILKEAVMLEANGNASSDNKIADFSALANPASNSSANASADTTASAFSFLDNLAGVGAGATGSTDNASASSSSFYPETDDSKARVLDRIGNKLTELDNRLFELMNRLQQVEMELRKRYN